MSKRERWCATVSFLAATSASCVGRHALASEEATSPLPERRITLTASGGAMVVPSVVALSDSAFDATGHVFVVPIAIDVGLFVSGALELNGFAQLAFATPFATGDLGGTDLRAGGGARLHFHPREAIDPWLGWSLGAEHYALGRTFYGTGVVVSPITLGLDCRLGNGLAIGPFASTTASVLSANRELAWANAGETTVSSILSVLVGVRAAFTAM
jgi:hypothetical protein